MNEVNLRRVAVSGVSSALDASNDQTSTLRRRSPGCCEIKVAAHVLDDILGLVIAEPVLTPAAPSRGGPPARPISECAFRWMTTRFRPKFRALATFDYPHSRKESAQ